MSAPEHTWSSTAERYGVALLCVVAQACGPLPSSYELRVRVVDPEGRPVHDARVSVVGLDTELDPPEGPRARLDFLAEHEEHTDEQGRALIALRAGRWRPWAVEHRVVQNPFECNPCPGYRCLVAASPLCIESVSVEQVNAAVGELLS